MKIFITGGLGYLGSKLSQKLVADGHSVVLYDSVIYGQNENKIIREISRKKRGAVSLVVGDTRNKKRIFSAIKKHSPDMLFHFGELVGVYACEKNPKLTRNINYNGSRNVVDACAYFKIPLVYNSSSSVYGNQKKNKLMKETDPVPAPGDYYCKYKLMMEKYIADKIKKTNGFKTIVFRPATVCGVAPRMRLELLPNHFTYCAIVKHKIKIAQPNSHRAVMDIDDLISAYIKLVDKGNWKSFIYNIGHYSIKKIECAKNIQKIYPCKIISDNNVGDTRNLMIDNSKFEKEFKWKSRITFENTVKKVGGWVKNNKSALDKNNFSGVINMPIKKWMEII